MKKVSLIFLLAFSCCMIFAAIAPAKSDYYEIPLNNCDPETKISQSEAIEDIYFLISKLTQTNPAIYKYISKKILKI